MIPQTTLTELIDRFEVILFDSDGVLTRWPDAIPGAPEVIRELNRLGKPYSVLTNDASALPETRSLRYANIGLNIDAGRIISSGMLLKDYFRKMDLAGSRCVVLGTEDSAAYVRQAGGEVVNFDQDFDVLVVGNQSGFPFLESMRAVLSSLHHKVKRGETPHLVLPNPDLVFPEGDGFAFASGSVGQMFESALALLFPDRSDLVFARLGKPQPAMFEEAIRRSGTRNMVMIGDTPATDIRGARNVGIASVLVETGVATLDLSLLPETDRPTFRMRSLAS